MEIILSIVDAAVLLLLIVLIPRSVLRGMSRGPGSLVLSICAAAFAIIFAVVSFTASVRFLESTAAQIVWVLVLLVMAYIVRVSWTTKSVE
jgi:uncharacterized membrane protein required for colicin V production